MSKMQGWDLDSSSSKVEFTKFPEGITKIRVVDESPNMRWTHWLMSVKNPVTCPGQGCPICEMRKNEKANNLAYTNNMAKRFSLQVINRNTGKLEIMEQGVTFMQDLKDVLEILDKKGKSLIDVDLEVKRRGTGKDNTSYRIDIGDEYELTDADKALMKDMKNLNEYFTPHEPEKILRVLNGEDWKVVMYNAEEETEEEFEVK